MLGQVSPRIAGSAWEPANASQLKLKISEVSDKFDWDSNTTKQEGSCLPIETFCVHESQTGKYLVIGMCGVLSGNVCILWQMGDSLDRQSRSQLSYLHQGAGPLFQSRKMA